jgi:RNA methyltransferase, TrmH family
MIRATAPVQVGRHSTRILELRRTVRGEDPRRTVVDGVRLVADLVHCGVQPIEIYTTAEHLPLLQAMPELRVLFERGTIFVADPNVLLRAAPTKHSKGLLAVMQVVERELPLTGVTVYLHEVQDPGNVGGIARSAAAFGATGVACSPGCANPFSPRAVRASAGHSLRIPVRANEALAPVADAVAAAGGEVAAALGSGGTPLALWRPRLPLLLVVGNEGQGLGADVLDRCSSTVTVPLAGGVESLNVTVAASLVLAHLAGLAGPPILVRQTGRSE